MLEDQNPLRSQIEQELHDSEWFQKFKAWGALLRNLKMEVPLTQLCELQWVTRSDDLLIHCPNAEIREALKQQSEKIDRLKGSAQRIILKHADYPDIIVGKAIPPVNP